MNSTTHFDFNDSIGKELSDFYDKIVNWKKSICLNANERFQICTADCAVIGSDSGSGSPSDTNDLFGAECSFTIEDVDATIAMVEKSGGKTLGPTEVIPKIGWITKFSDPDGNTFYAIKCDQDAQ